MFKESYEGYPYVDPEKGYINLHFEKEHATKYGSHYVYSKNSKTVSLGEEIEELQGKKIRITIEVIEG